MQSQAHHSIGTLADALANEVVVQVFDGAICGAELLLGRLAIFKILEDLVLRVSIFLLLLSRLLYDLGTLV